MHVERVIGKQVFSNLLISFCCLYKVVCLDSDIFWKYIDRCQIELYYRLRISISINRRGESRWSFNHKAVRFANEKISQHSVSTRLFYYQCPIWISKIPNWTIQQLSQSVSRLCLQALDSSVSNQIVVLYLRLLTSS